MDAKEKLYDEKIAPLLLKAGRLCEKHGLPFVASVEFNPGRLASTVIVPEDSSLAIVMAFWSLQCNGNFDAFVIRLRKWIGDKPHNSACLRLLESTH